VADFTRAASCVKICGVTSIHDAQVVIDAGADALGLIFAESTRQLSPSSGRRIAESTRGGILRVGVFRHDSDEFVLRCVDETGVDAAQIHGSLSDELLDALRRRDVAVIKALSVGGDEFSHFDEERVDAVLIDGPTPGSGREHPWPDLEARNFQRPVIVAGGLDPENVASVARLTRAWGVDVSSGVESAPGVKDASRVRDFVMNARTSLERPKEPHD
jgi:phosphoribosylanthranilate isomerase